MGLHQEEPQQQYRGGFHAMILSAPEYGHLNPFLQLALHLSSRGAAITVISTADALAGKAIRPAAQQHPLIRFVPIALDEDHSLLPGSGPDSHVDRVLALFGGFARHGPAQLEQIIHGLNNNHGGCRPVSCLISDFFFPWAGEVARKCEVMWCIFWPSSASMLCNCILEANKLEVQEGEVSEDCPDTSVLPFLKDHAGGLAINKRFSRYLMHPTKAMRKLDYVIANTLDDLEKEALSAIPLSAHVLTIGPLFYGLNTENGHGNSEKEGADSVISWLDKQERHSVLYISFGSWVHCEQLEKLALGVEASGSSFLWVVKRNEVPQPLKGFMDGFVERNKGKGLIVEWASQERVLEHQAVGVFLTHCGWNSVLEAVTMGVPMLCCPILGDQFLNSSVVEQQLKIGRGVDMQKLQANEVTSIVKDLMADEVMRHQATLLSCAARKAVQPGGLSHQNLEEFLNSVTLA